MPANVTVDSFVPELWDAGIIRARESKLVAKQICKRNPDNPAKKAFDTVHYSGIADPTINLTWSGTMTYEDMVAAGVDLLIDKQYNYGFKVGDIAKAMTEIDLQGSQNQRAGYKMQQAIDTYLMSLYDQAHTDNIVTDATLDATTIISSIGECVRRLEEKDVGEGMRWMTVPPWVKQKLLLGGIKFQIRNGIEGKGGISWCDELGIDLFVTNQVYRAATTPQHYCMFGSYDSIVFHEALMETKAIQDKDDPFATFVAGIDVFGAKVIRPQELGYLNATYAAETAI